MRRLRSWISQVRRSPPSTSRPRRRTLDRYIQRLFPNRRADAVLIEAMVDGGKKLSDKPSPRRAIVAVDFNAPDSSAVQTMNQAAENIRKSGATVWTVSVRGTSIVQQS